MSSLGRQQSQLAGEVLAGRGLREPLIVSGTLVRQQDTATIAMAAMGRAGSPDRTDGRWNEYDHVDLVAKRVESESPERRAEVLGDSRLFQTVLDQVLFEWIGADDHGEGGWRAFADGAVEALRELAREIGSGRDAVVATSGGVIAAVCAHLLGGGVDTVVALNRVTVNASLTTVITGRSGISLLSFNDHAHLTGERSRLRTYR